MGVAVNSDFFKFTYEFRRHNLKQLDKNKPRVSCSASSSISKKIKKIKRTTTITTHAAASSSPAPGAHYPGLFSCPFIIIIFYIIHLIIAYPLYTQHLRN